MFPLSTIIYSMLQNLIVAILLNNQSFLGLGLNFNLKPTIIFLTKFLKTSNLFTSFRFLLLILFQF